MRKKKKKKEEEEGTNLPFNLKVMSLIHTGIKCSFGITWYLNQWHVMILLSSPEKWE